MTYTGKPIGLNNLTMWPVTEDTDTAYTVGEPVKLARAIRVQLSPQFAEGLLESDDGVEDETTLLTHVDVTIDASQLTEAIRAQLLGHETDAAGGMAMARTDAALKIALAFKSLLSKEAGEDKHVYAILYAGKFQEFSETFETVTRGGITYQTHTGLTGRFYPRAIDGDIQYRLRKDATADPDNAAKIAAWFEEPQVVGAVGA